VSGRTTGATPEAWACAALPDALIANDDSALLPVDAETGVILAASPPARELLGAGRGGTVGFSLAQVHPAVLRGRSWPAHVEHCRASRHTGQVSDITTGGGTTVPVA
jgi:hypothetical protein